MDERIVKKIKDTEYDLRGNYLFSVVINLIMGLIIMLIAASGFTRLKEVKIVTMAVSMIVIRWSVGNMLWNIKRSRREFGHFLDVYLHKPDAKFFKEKEENHIPRID